MNRLVVVLVLDAWGFCARKEAAEQAGSNRIQADGHFEPTVCVPL